MLKGTREALLALATISPCPRSAVRVEALSHPTVMGDTTAGSLPPASMVLGTPLPGHALSLFLNLGEINMP